jgi:hypothetical protein
LSSDREKKKKRLREAAVQVPFVQSDDDELVGWAERFGVGCDPK